MGSKRYRKYIDLQSKFLFFDTGIGKGEYLRRFRE